VSIRGRQHQTSSSTSSFPKSMLKQTSPRPRRPRHRTGEFRDGRLDYRPHGRSGGNQLNGARITCYQKKNNRMSYRQCSRSTRGHEPANWNNLSSLMLGSHEEPTSDSPHTGNSGRIRAPMFTLPSTIWTPSSQCFPMSYTPLSSPTSLCKTQPSQTLEASNVDNELRRRAVDEYQPTQDDFLSRSRSTVRCNLSVYAHGA
jgi:hypothetical protein